MLALLSRIIKFFSATNARTWIGHSLLAAGLMVPFVLFAMLFFPIATLAAGVSFNVGFWVQREVIADWFQQIPVIGLKAANEKFEVDGWKDMAFPIGTAVLITILAVIFVV